MDQIRVRLIGSAFCSNIHAEAFEEVTNAQVTAVCSRTRANVEAFGRKWGVSNIDTDYRKLLERKDVDVVVVAIPNDLHREVVVAAAEAGKQIIIEKPLARTLDDADQMIAACKKNRVKLMYAETIIFSPKYVRAKKMADEGAVGDVYLVKQGEKHDGPHTPWFYDVQRSGGGALMDLGCPRN